MMSIFQTAFRGNSISNQVAAPLWSAGRNRHTNRDTFVQNEQGFRKLREQVEFNSSHFWNGDIGQIDMTSRNVGTFGLQSLAFGSQFFANFGDEIWSGAFILITGLIALHQLYIWGRHFYYRREESDEFPLGYVWIEDHGRPECVTNCEIQSPSNDLVPPPVGSEADQLKTERVKIETPFHSFYYSSDAPVIFSPPLPDSWHDWPEEDLLPLKELAPLSMRLHNYWTVIPDIDNSPKPTISGSQVSAEYNPLSDVQTDFPSQIDQGQEASILAERPLVQATCPKCTRENTTCSEFCPSPQCEFPLMIIGEKYRLIRKIGVGGGGVVYQAENINLDAGNRRAIKIIPKPDGIEDEQWDTTVKRFQQEVAVLNVASDGNEHIARVYDDSGYVPLLGLYFVMEYVDGRGLAGQMGSLGLNDAEVIFQQICEAVNTCHERGVIHRDLKPENILLVNRGYGSPSVKIIDFGISKNLTAGTEKITRQNLILGTPEYMPPEQFEGKEPTPQMDIYALGIMLYQMLTGGLYPYHYEPTQEPIINAAKLFTILRDEQTSPIPMASRFSDRHHLKKLDPVVGKAIAKSPVDRYKSIGGFYDAFKAARENILPQSETLVYGHDVLLKKR